MFALDMHIIETYQVQPGWYRQIMSTDKTKIVKLAEEVAKVAEVRVVDLSTRFVIHTFVKDQQDNVIRFDTRRRIA